ncbi:uncharacterized protein LOC128959665 [Oppia nitens]|uniref:uncharacterized protein LOC128959665 n=1 Tax=Oppia nitens TaxID=1686743 RepID=UPI0023DB34A1|nr:uncharacterized protein LOC128959665 [Oppia nitens]
MVAVGTTNTTTTTGNDKGQQRDDQFYKQIVDYINSLSIRDQFKAMYTADHVFGEDCWVIRPMLFTANNNNNTTGDYIPCRLVGPIRRSVDYFNQCFTIFSQNTDSLRTVVNNHSYSGNRRFTIDFDTTIQNYWLEIMNLKILAKNNIPSVNLFIHSGDRRIYDSWDYNMITVDYRRRTKSCIKYHKTRVQLMPWPYETQCVDNHMGSDRSGVGGRGGRVYRSYLDCLIQCKIHELRKRPDFLGGQWPGNFLIDESDTGAANDNHTMIINVIELMGDNTSADLTIGRKCRHQCGQQQDCRKSYYTFFETKFLNKSETMFVMDVFPPDLPDLLVLHSAKLQLEEFGCYLASIFSLWFGLSILTVWQTVGNSCRQLNELVITYKSRLKLVVNNPVLIVGTRVKLSRSDQIN